MSSEFSCLTALQFNLNLIAHNPHRNRFRVQLRLVLIEIRPVFDTEPPVVDAAAHHVSVDQPMSE